MTPADGYIEDSLEWSHKNGTLGAEYSEDGNTGGGVGGMTLIALHTTHHSKRWCTSAPISLTADTSLGNSSCGDGETEKK
jgi:hypothetical protein